MKTLLSLATLLLAAPALAADLSWDTDMDPVAQYKLSFGVPRALTPWRWRPEPKPNLEWQTRLDAAVFGFLKTWLEQRDAAAAVATHYSTLIDDEKIIPLSAYEENWARFERGADAAAPKPIANADAARKMAAHLSKYIEQRDGNAWRFEVPKQLAPIRKDSELRYFLPGQGITPLISGGGKLASFPAARYTDVSWSASLYSVQFSAISERTTAKDYHLRGVYCLFEYKAGDRTGYSPLLMIWADESDGDDGNWKLWSVESVPTE